jgi:hypothetical protein
MVAEIGIRGTSSWLCLTASDGDFNRYTITFLTIDDAERAAHAILGAIAKARPATAPQGLVVEDVV